MAPHRIDTHNHPYPAAYVEKTRDVLKATTHAFYDRIVMWQPAQTIEAMDKDGMMERSDDPASLWTGEAGRAWAWAVADKNLEKRLLGYNDV